MLSVRSSDGVTPFALKCRYKIQRKDLIRKYCKITRQMIKSIKTVVLLQNMVFVTYAIQKQIYKQCKWNIFYIKKRVFCGYFCLLLNIISLATRHESYT